MQPHPTTVLVVDDDSASRSLLCDQVTSAGHACLQARDGRLALDILADGRIDLLIFDLEMPGMDGWELRRKMLGDPRLAPIRAVVVSGHRQVDGEAPHVEAVIEKPINPDLLLALLDEDQHRAEEDGSKRAKDQRAAAERAAVESEPGRLRSIDTTASATSRSS